MAQSDKNSSGFRCERNSERHRTLILTRGSTLPAYFDTRSEEDVFNALEAIKTDVTSGKRIRWKKILPVILGIRANDQTAPDCLNFAKALLGLFEKYHCKDIGVISEVFAVLLSLTEPHQPLLNKSTQFKKMFVSPYGEGRTDTDLVFSALTCGNLGLLKLQLRFGMLLTLPYRSACWLNIYTLLLGWPTDADDDVREDENTADYEVFVEDGMIRGHGTVKRTEEFIKKNLSSNFNAKSLKRLCLVLKLLRILLEMKLRGPNYAEYFIECYRLLFDSIPETFVTSPEVEASLERCLPVNCSRFISTITKDFKSMLPELAEVPQPRSLKHLCRIPVRQSLRQNLSLPHGVASLPLPTKLKEYIMLDDDGDYSVIIKNSLDYDLRRNLYSSSPESYINIPEKDDWVTSFLKQL